MSVIATILAACVGAAAALASAYLANSVSRRLKLGVQDRRVKAYEQLWAVTGVAATTRLKGDWAGGPLSEDERCRLFHASTEWYYGTGSGLFLSRRTRDLYLKTKVNLLCPKHEIVPAGALDEFQYARDTEEKRGILAIRQLSLLRWVMRFDLDIRTEPYNTDLTPKEIELLELCNIDPNKLPFKNNWQRARPKEVPNGEGISSAH
jgi:hypothetical protein